MKEAESEENPQASSCGETCAGPVALGIVHFQADFIRSARAAAAVSYSGASIQIPANGPYGNVLIQLPKSLGDQPHAVTANVEGGRNFIVRSIRRVEIYEHPDRNAGFSPARERSVCQLSPSGRAPTGNAMVRGRKGQWYERAKTRGRGNLYAECTKPKGATHHQRLPSARRSGRDGVGAAMVSGRQGRFCWRHRSRWPRR